ncbi:hypothetical protein ACWOC1_14285 [Enterococcus quebecensis]|uniref:Uncharacterized protein n=1 Tax=Enterococcus quebecensis TaxID=903983 RepID=A0A1E5GX23_9ENTE|nr:hypothetical protein [Enterococcus quebecensis]OEG17217.1 hypothetical protein BCR23_04225 [Enterococcus quebecensis]OJG75609.1 hypothetical protein RV12_GL001412 [Enterococcus quebecensis]
MGKFNWRKLLSLEKLYTIAKFFGGVIISVSTLYIAWVTYDQEKYSQPLEFTPTIELKLKSIEYVKNDTNSDYTKSLTFDFFIKSNVDSGAIKSLYIFYNVGTDKTEPATSFLKKDTQYNELKFFDGGLIPKKIDRYKGDLQYNKLPPNKNFIQTYINLLAIDYNDNKHIIKQYFYFDTNSFSKIDSQAQAKKGVRIIPETEQVNFEPILTENLYEHMIMSSSNQLISDMNAEIIDVLKKQGIEEKKYFLINRKKTLEERDVIIQTYNKFYKK